MLIILASVCLLALVGCDKKKPNAEYTGIEAYETISVTEHNAEVVKPSSVVPTRGIVMYVGTIMPAKVYNNIATMLAKRGYYVAMPTVEGNMTYNFYKKNEEVMDAMPSMKFAVAGHSQGGGAAAKRLAEERYSTQTVGGIFLSPLFYRDNDLRAWEGAALLIEAEFDKVLTEVMRSDARSKMPASTESHTILGGNHMGYSSMTFPADGKMTITVAEQQQQTAKLVLRYLARLAW